MCTTSKTEKQLEDIQNLKDKIKILSRKIIQLKPELKEWIKKNMK